MYKKIIVTISFIILSIYGMAQNNLNDYKYIIVPKKFDFSKGEDQYQLNSLTKFLFNKYGYKAYFVDEDFPEDLKGERCLALTAEVSNEKSGMFKTKLEINLKDCYGKKIMISKIGESRLKKFDKAYNEALRSAFETYQNFEYSYNPKEKIVTNSRVSSTVEESKTESTENEKVEEKIEVKDKVVEVIEIPTNQVVQQVYYAQTIKDGFQVVDSEPKIIMVLLTTTKKDVYLVKGKNAIVYKDEDSWYYSENNGELQKTSLLMIKF